MPTDPTNVPAWLDALAGSHDRLSDLVGELSDERLQAQSYCDEWTVAQVLSHIGSGAEIMEGSVDAAVTGGDPPSRETYSQIWDRWNAMGTREVAEAALTTDGELVAKLERLGDGLEDMEFVVFGGAMRTDAVGLIRMRLGEHALHTWDVAVALDPHALVDHTAVSLLVDQLAQVLAFLGKAERADVPRPFTVRIVTSDPERKLDLAVGESITMAPAGGATDDGASGGAAAAATLHLPAEALLRLVYGRLDPSHAPTVAAQEQPALDTLRRVFPGF